jgi:hypothetical protein
MYQKLKNTVKEIVVRKTKKTSLDKEREIME